MTAPKHADPTYHEWLDLMFAVAIKEFVDATGSRPTWSIGRHEKPRDPFFPLDQEWVRR